MKSEERISILFLRERTGESWSLRVPLAVFRFLLVVLVALVILAGFTVTWLGAISVRLQTADAMARENTKLRTDLRRVDQLAEELQIMEEQQKRVLALTQAFLDDSAKQRATTQTVLGFYDDQTRSRVVNSFASWLECSQEHRTTLSQPIHPIFLRSPVESWTPSGDKAMGSDSLFLKTLLVEPSAPVRSPADGLVMHAGWDPMLGLGIEIATPEGYRIHLAQLGELDVKAGDFIRMGERIGRTGVGSGVEPVSLAIEVFVNGLAIDPMFAMMR